MKQHALVTEQEYKISNQYNINTSVAM